MPSVLVSRFLNAIDPFNLGVLLSRFQIKIVSSKNLFFNQKHFLA
nr:hypothetical protein [Helicobacter pylori]